MSQSRQGDAGGVAVVAKLDLPDVELTPELLNDVFVAEIALQRAQYGQAVKLYRKLAQETRDPRIAERATKIALFARDYQVALEIGNLWIELDEGNVDGRQILTTLLVKSGDYDVAVDSLEALLAKSAQDDKSRYSLISRLLGREQNKEGAIEVMKRFLDRHPDDATGLYAYSQLALRGGKMESAEQTVDRLLKQKPDWAEAVILRTRVLQATNREVMAMEYLSEVVARRGRDVELRVTYGKMLMDAGRVEEALDHFRYVLKVQPDNDDIVFAVGLVALQLDKFDEAEEHFLKLNYKSVRVNETSYYLGRIEENRNNSDKAIRWYSSVSRGNNFLNAKIRSALLQAKQGDVDAARAHLQAVQARSPGQRLRLFLAEGEVLRAVDLDVEAMEVYDRALKEVPGNTELLYARAMVAEKLGRLDILEGDLLAILEREPDHFDALNSLGYTLADRTDRHEEALTYVRRALELKPDAFYILDSMGWVHYRLGNFDKSIEYLRRALGLNHDPEIAAHLGEVLWAAGDRGEARNIWQRALDQSPESKTLLNVIERLEQ
jgi:tetratricopeptide (TPR) repeat protein